MSLSDCDSSAADGALFPVRGGEGLSSLLGGVLKGEILASEEGRLCFCSGSRLSVPVCDAIVAIVGLAGIFGLSALLTGGGFGATG